MHTVNAEILIERASNDRVLDEAQLAAAAFLAPSLHRSPTLELSRAGTTGQHLTINIRYTNF
jgi:hypothetical protein